MLQVEPLAFPNIQHKTAILNMTREPQWPPYLGHNMRLNIG